MCILSSSFIIVSPYVFFFSFNSEGGYGTFSINYKFCKLYSALTEEITISTFIVVSDALTAMAMESCGMQCHIDCFKGM
jgi:hypothetical protein